jgi:predicted  nucleic acid-binding Zn-ribbon protein
MNTEMLEKQIYDLENEIAALENEIADYEIDPYDFEDEYCEALDCEGPVSVCGFEFNPSDILKEMDPTAYRCGLVDYVDSIDINDLDEFSAMAEKLEEMKEELSLLEEELEELENEGDE